MMFSAGMGIGLMFYGVAEPISHLAAPPLGQARPNTPEAAEAAMEWTYFHWALHPWALYAIVGMALGYFCFRRGIGNRHRAPLSGASEMAETRGNAAM
jgi:glycine betaine transporter